MIKLQRSASLPPIDTPPPRHFFIIISWSITPSEVPRFIRSHGNTQELGTLPHMQTTNIPWKPTLPSPNQPCSYCHHILALNSGGSPLTHQSSYWPLELQVGCLSMECLLPLSLCLPWQYPTALPLLVIRTIYKPPNPVEALSWVTRYALMQEGFLSVAFIG